VRGDVALFVRETGFACDLANLDLLVLCSYSIYFMLSNVCLSCSHSASRTAYTAW
jgi:hypothetical protein